MRAHAKLFMTRLQKKIGVGLLPNHVHSSLDLTNLNLKNYHILVNKCTVRYLFSKQETARNFPYSFLLNIKTRSPPGG